MASAKNLFGTDGIRGIAGRDLTAGLAFGVGRAAGESAGDGRVLVGMDTRPSGPELSQALRSGLRRAGVEPVDLGVIPAGGISHLTVAAGAAMGVVISASHNPAPYNGIKTARTRRRPSSATTWRRRSPSASGRPTSNGRRRREGTPLDRSGPRASRCTWTGWQVLCQPTCPGCRSWSTAPTGPPPGRRPGFSARWGWRPRPPPACPDGSKINHGCGATHPEWVGSKSEGRIGLALDGDADRLIAVDETGAIVDGDFLMAILARHLQGTGRLRPPLVVATVMSNLGFHLAMSSRGIDTALTRVGDRYVREEMIRRGAVLGGEQSGHIIFGNLAVTGDGLLTALQLLEVVALSGKRLAELRSEAMERLPQVLVNVEVDRPGKVEGVPEVWEAVSQVGEELGENGRVLVRPSGTEPLVRVMIECRESELAERYARDLAGVIAAAMNQTATERE